MSHVQMDRSFADQKAPGRVAFVATLLFPVVGVACLRLSEQVAGYLPHILGGVMLFVGAADIVTDLSERNSEPGKITVGTDGVMIVLGIVMLLNTAEANLGHHVLLLGLELIGVPFHVPAEPHSGAAGEGA